MIVQSDESSSKLNVDDKSVNENVPTNSVCHCCDLCCVRCCPWGESCINYHVSSFLSIIDSITDIWFGFDLFFLVKTAYSEYNGINGGISNYSDYKKEGLKYAAYASIIFASIGSLALLITLIIYFYQCLSYIRNNKLMKIDTIFKDEMGRFHDNASLKISYITVGLTIFVDIPMILITFYVIFVTNGTSLSNASLIASISIDILMIFWKSLSIFIAMKFGKSIFYKWSDHTPSSGDSGFPSPQFIVAILCCNVHHWPKDKRAVLCNIIIAGLAVTIGSIGMSLYFIDNKNISFNHYSNLMYFTIVICIVLPLFTTCSCYLIQYFIQKDVDGFSYSDFFVKFCAFWGLFIPFSLIILGSIFIFADVSDKIELSAKIIILIGIFMVLIGPFLSIIACVSDSTGNGVYTFAIGCLGYCLCVVPLIIGIFLVIGDFTSGTTTGGIIIIVIGSIGTCATCVVAVKATGH